MLCWTILFFWLCLSFHWIAADGKGWLESAFLDCLMVLGDRGHQTHGMERIFSGLFSATQYRYSAGATRGGKNLSESSPATGWWARSHQVWMTLCYAMRAKTPRPTGAGRTVPVVDDRNSSLLQLCYYWIWISLLSLCWAPVSWTYGQRKQTLLILFCFKCFVYTCWLFQVQASQMTSLRYMKEKRKIQRTHFFKSQVP